MSTKAPRGLILYEGISILDNAPIVVIATLRSTNAKTGDMVQTWIMRSDIDPIEASKNSLDSSICGSCPHRHSLGGSCYVNLGQAPLSIWRAYKRGSYPHIEEDSNHEYLKGRFIRLGSYGDPAAAPIEIWERVTRLSSGWTGYTHQYNHRNFNKDLLKFCIVSADTPRASLKFKESKIRTFRVKTADAPLLENEIECPADTGVKCADCRACSGALDPQASIAITVHGSRAKRYIEKFGRANTYVARSSHA